MTGASVQKIICVYNFSFKVHLKTNNKTINYYIFPGTVGRSIINLSGILKAAVTVINVFEYNIIIVPAIHEVSIYTESEIEF